MWQTHLTCFIQDVSCLFVDVADVVYTFEPIWLKVKMNNIYIIIYADVRATKCRFPFNLAVMV